MAIKSKGDKTNRQRKIAQRKHMKEVKSPHSKPLPHPTSRSGQGDHRSLGPSSLLSKRFQQMNRFLDKIALKNGWTKRLSVEVNHVTSVVKFSINRSTLSRKRVDWFHLERIFTSPTLDTFCGRPVADSSSIDPSILPPTSSSLYDDDSEDSDIDGTVEDMESMMSTSFSLRPTVSEIDDLAESWTLNPTPTYRKTMLNLLLFLLPFLPSTHSALTSSDVSAYNSWSTWSLTDRLRFLLYDEDWDNLRVEFQKLDRESNNNATLEDFMREHSEFQDPSTISSFFSLCVSSCSPSPIPSSSSSSSSSDQNPPPCCDFMAYVIARGEHDSSGNVYDNNEWDMREEIFLTSYQEAVNNPKITEEELELLGLKVGLDDVLEGEL
ncbi:hypothetical protein TrCOL_g339 [Triparma columacea]|uniref:Uncharacterized protein n=1 Tax=Triparma columacea TaxID=722753 RepID=A0A9W7LAJ4_9STRA|nr:hypothetical protein TrCOL_g339 [Triparma columacea]